MPDPAAEFKPARSMKCRINDGRTYCETFSGTSYEADVLEIGSGAVAAINTAPGTQGLSITFTPAARCRMSFAGRGMREPDVLKCYVKRK